MFVFDLIKRVKNTKPAVSERYWTGDNANVSGVGRTGNMGIDHLDEDGHVVGRTIQRWENGRPVSSGYYPEEYHTETER